MPYNTSTLESLDLSKHALLIVFLAFKSLTLINGKYKLLKFYENFLFQVGTMHERLPKSIPFTIVSGDKGFLEVERQMRAEERRAIVIDPHCAQKHSNDMIYVMVTSVTDT